MMGKTTRIDFRKNSRNTSPAVVTATQKSTRTALLKRAEVVAEFGEERWQELRRAGHEIPWPAPVMTTALFFNSITFFLDRCGANGSVAKFTHERKLRTWLQ